MRHCPVQESALLLFVRMANPFQRSESELHGLAAAERRGYFIENGIENTHRIPARQTPLPQLLYDISLIHSSWFDIRLPEPLAA